MKPIVDISLTGMFIGYFIAILTLLLFYFNKTKMQKKFIVSLVRMTVQLLTLGILLKYLFSIKTSWYLFILVLFMSFSASQIIVTSSKIPFRNFFKTISMVIFAVVSVTTVFFVLVILGLDGKNFFSAQYLIPISGMLLGNSMNAGVIMMKTMNSDINEKKNIIEQKLALGANPKESIQPILKKAFKLSLLPPISSMAGMGMVSLPGMMTGQILSGTNPLVAVKYQLMIMIFIILVVSINGILILNFSYKNFFNKKYQLLIKD